MSKVMRLAWFTHCYTCYTAKRHASEKTCSWAILCTSVGVKESYTERKVALGERKEAGGRH